MFVALLIISCRNSDSIAEDFNKVNTDNHSLLSRNIIGLGAKSIDISNGIIKFDSFKGFKINGNIEYLSSYIFSYKNNILEFKNTDKYKLYSISNTFYIESPSFKGKLLEMPQDLFNNDKNLTILIVVLGELTETNNKKVDYNIISKLATSNNQAKDGGCSFFSTMYSVGVGLNASAAWSNYHFHESNDISSGQLDGCSPIGNPELSNIGVAYYVTRAYCC